MEKRSWPTEGSCSLHRLTRGIALLRLCSVRSSSARPLSSSFSGGTAWRGKPMRVKRSRDGRGTTTIKNLSKSQLLLCVLPEPDCFFSHCKLLLGHYFNTHWPLKIVDKLVVILYFTSAKSATQDNAIWRI